jgi:hypothetical protein
LKLLALPLLPANRIEEGVSILVPPSCSSAQADAAVKRIHTYMKSFWIMRVHPARLSVYGRTRRTNCDLESYHRGLANFIKTPHPNLWNFLESLTKAVDVHYSDCTRAESGQRVRRIKSKSLPTTKRIRDASQKLNLELITVSEFLTLTAFAGEKMLEHVIGKAESIAAEQQYSVQPSVQQYSVQPSVYGNVQQLCSGNISYWFDEDSLSDAIASANRALSALNF